MLSPLVRSVHALRDRESVKRLADSARHTAEQLRVMGRGMTTPRCTRCGYLSSPAHIAAHNVACANGGERQYPSAWVTR